MLKQPDGTLWSTYNATFQKLMVKDGSTYRPAPGSSLTLSKPVSRLGESCGGYFRRSLQKWFPVAELHFCNQACSQ